MSKRVGIFPTFFFVHCKKITISKLDIDSHQEDVRLHPSGIFCFAPIIIYITCETITRITDTDEGEKKFKNKSKIIWNMCLYVVYLYRNQKQNIMIKSVEEKTSRLEIDLTGSEGNAFVLLGYASRLSKQLGLDHQKVQSEMTSGDYENLVDTFDKYFGEYVTLYR